MQFKITAPIISFENSVKCYKEREDAMSSLKEFKIERGKLGMTINKRK